MKKFYPISFGIGLLSGFIVLFLGVGAVRLLWPSSSSSPSSQHQKGGGSNLSRTAQNLGMTTDELKKELATGKTVQDIAKEKGISLSSGGWKKQDGTASGSALQTSSGAVKAGEIRSSRSAS